MENSKGRKKEHISYHVAFYGGTIFNVIVISVLLHLIKSETLAQKCMYDKNSTCRVPWYSSFQTFSCGGVWRIQAAGEGTYVL